MKVYGVYSNSANVNFSAHPVGSAKSLLENGKDIVIYSLNKNKDRKFLNDLRMAFLSSKTLKYLKFHEISTLGFDAVRSIYKNIIIGTCDGKPFGLAVYHEVPYDKRLYLDYFLTWKPDNINKVKLGGKVLLREVAQQAKDKKLDIWTAPLDDKYDYYLNIGFKRNYPDGMSDVFLKSENLDKFISELDKIMHYKKNNQQQEVDLSSILTI